MAKMSLESFVFKAPRNDIDVEQTINKSRFIGSIRTVLSAEEATKLIKEFSTIYPKATHYCWAYRIGINNPLEHSSDAGEPSGTAGRPILGALKRHFLDNTLLVVTRYYGGVKLGVRGLIDAYGDTAEIAATEAGAVEMELNNMLELSCGYDYSKTMTVTLHQLGFPADRISINYGIDVDFRIEVPCSMRISITPLLEEMVARGFLTLLNWNEEYIVRERWVYQEL